jgi:hypothetical protein
MASESSLADREDNMLVTDNKNKVGHHRDSSNIHIDNSVIHNDIHHQFSDANMNN